MDVYDSEQEQIDSIKKWWKENGKSIIVGAVLGFGSLFGWQQWQTNIQVAGESASAEYDFLLTALEQNDIQTVKNKGMRLVGEYKDTAYAPLAALALAKIDVEAGELDSARGYLQSVIDQNEQPQLKKVAELRMARLLLADDQADQALSLIRSASVGGFSAPFAELEGDIQVAKGNRDLARKAYQRALAVLEPGVDSGLLNMKLDDVGGPEADI